MVLARWGLLPSWAKDMANMPHPFNAKVETAALKPMFLHSIAGNDYLDCYYQLDCLL
ncbi:MAG: SOS response-associated peptidase family protein [Pseudomonadota bacterium]